jgi:L-malate glycosyltransferase
LRIALIGPPLKFLFGGQEVQASDLVACWSHDPEADVDFVSSRPDLPHFLRIIDNLPYLRTIARFPLYLSRLCRAAYKVEILHVFAASFSSFLVATAPALVVGQILDKRILVHYHSGRAEDHLRRSPAARYMLRACDLVVVPSEFLAGVFKEHHIPTAIVPNVVDVTRFAYQSREPLRPRLLCTRNLECHYGVEIVVQAFARIQKEFPEATLYLVGKGPSEIPLREMVRKLQLKNVEFKGATPPDRMRTVYAQHDIFVNGSYVDCSPVSILEAFCSGLPVVTAAAGGIPDLVEHERTGLLSPPGDSIALAANVTRILRQQDFARSLACQARQMAESHAWKNLRAGWLQIYHSLGA